MVGATTISPSRTRKTTKLFSLVFFAFVALSPLNLFVFATVKIENPFGSSMSPEGGEIPFFFYWVIIIIIIPYRKFY